jgi:hypothetical protein
MLSTFAKVLDANNEKTHKPDVASDYSGFLPITFSMQMKVRWH